MEISVIIVVGKDAQLLQRTIRSVRTIAEDIHIIDIGLPDNIEKELSGVIVHPWTQDVLYVELIREHTKKFATNEWILMLDPDEELSPELIETIQKMKSPSYDYVSIHRKNIIFGTWIRHSRWWPDPHVRLFRKNAVTWPQIIHARPVCTGRKFELPPEQGTIIHQNYTDIDQFLSKAIRYAKAQAEERPDITFPQTSQLAMTEFFSRFWVAKGYKDGMHGLILALLQMFQCYLIFMFAWQKRQYDKTPEHQVKQYAHEIFHSGFSQSLFYAKGLVGKLLRILIS